jgi:hypothetical protein
MVSAQSEAEANYPCEGCGEPRPEGDRAALWLFAPLGLCCVHVHRRPECANAAKARRGGGRWRPKPLEEEGSDAEA